MPPVCGSYGAMTDDAAKQGKEAEIIVPAKKNCIIFNIAFFIALGSILLCEYTDIKNALPTEAHTEIFTCHGNGNRTEESRFVHY